MILRIDPAAALPVIEQIRRQITRLVVSGQLAVGDQLPPIRQLAADLELARGTVARAYELLERDGVVETMGRHGTRVRSRGTPTRPGAALERAADDIAVVGHQLGESLETVVSAVEAAWRRLG